MSTMKRIVCLVIAASLWSAGTSESAEQRRQALASLTVGQVAPTFKLEFLNKEKDFDLKEFNACLTGGRIKEEYKINKAEKVVTIVGRLEEWKGHHVFLEAASKVLDRSNHVRFLVVGDGVMRNPLEALSKKLGIMSYVIFCGHRNDIPQILAASDLLVSASFGEHFGRVIIEAMAMEKPVVATKAGGVPELVIDGETGILVKPADSEGLASAILRLLEDPQRSKEMGNSGLKRVMEYFGIDRHVRDIEKIYEPLLH